MVQLVAEAAGAVQCRINGFVMRLYRKGAGPAGSKATAFQISPRKKKQFVLWYRKYTMKLSLPSCRLPWGCTPGQEQLDSAITR